MFSMGPFLNGQPWCSCQRRFGEEGSGWIALKFGGIFHRHPAYSHPSFSLGPPYKRLSYQPARKTVATFTSIPAPMRKKPDGLHHRALSHNRYKRLSGITLPGSSGSRQPLYDLRQSPLPPDRNRARYRRRQRFSGYWSGTRFHGLPAQ